MDVCSLSCAWAHDKMLPKHFTAYKFSLIGSERLFISLHFKEKSRNWNENEWSKIAFNFRWTCMWYTANVLKCIVIGQWKWVKNNILNRHNQSIANELHWMHKRVWYCTFDCWVGSAEVDGRLSRMIAELKWINSLAHAPQY